MSDNTPGDNFTIEEKAALRSLAEIFPKHEDREKLRELIRQGVTITQLVDAYKGQRWFVSVLKTTAAILAALTAIFLFIKGINQGNWK